MATRDNLAAILEPYRGKRGDLKKALGDSGLRMLADLVGPSPTAMVEFLGYPKASQANMTRELQRLGIETVKRDWARPDGDRSEDDAALVDWWRLQTQQIERAVQYAWTVPSGTEYVKLHVLGDLHFGNAAQDSAALEEFVGWLADQPHDRWILAGDLFELRTKSGKGGPPILTQEQCKRLASLVLAPIMDRCLCVHAGNHDLRVIRETDMPYNPAQEFAKAHKVPYNGLDGFHRITLRAGRSAEQVYTGYVHHGFGGARTPGARRNQLVQMLSQTNADYVAMAHLHDRDATGKQEFGPDEAGIIGQWERPVVRTGAWLRHIQGSYSREAGMPPGSKGAVTLHLYCAKHGVHARR